MKIKCEWLNCKFNTADRNDHRSGANGDCKCENEIYLEASPECERCEVDNLICKNYVGKKYNEN